MPPLPTATTDDKLASPAIKAVKIDLPEGISAGEAFRACLRSCLDEHLPPNESRWLAAKHADNLHQTRVSWRRARAAMSLFRPLLDEAGLDLKVRMREIVLPLGPARDADVLLARAVDEEWPAGDVRKLRGRRRGTYAVANALLRSPQWREIKTDLGAWLDAPDWLAEDEVLRDGPARSVTDPALAKRHRRLVAAGDQLPTMPAHDLHRVRIEGKKLRYGCEFFAGLYADSPGSPPADYAEKLSAMQDAFGAANDLAVARHTLAAHDIPLDRVAAVADRQDAIDRWREVVELMPFWLS